MDLSSEQLRQQLQERLGLNLSGKEDWFRSEPRPLDPATLDAWVERLTVNESYFFRDAGQIQLLRETWLPQLILQAQGRPLRIWSAGCASGEEIYTISVLLREIPGAPLDAELLGTDLSPRCIQEARLGVYREHSLREIPVGDRLRYFRPREAGKFELLPELRRTVRFEVVNLCDPSTPWPQQQDLILCRNVLIHLRRELHQGLMERFFNSLRIGGLLLTGHGEFLTLDLPFETLSYDQSLIYRRPDPVFKRSAAPQPPASLPRSQGDSMKPPPCLCQRARSLRLAGQPQEARELLRQAIYLDPDNVHAFLELGLLESNGSPTRARNHYRAACLLLARLDSPGRLDPGILQSLHELESRLV